ncbi:hypothetical protein C8F04DRAFT_1255843 [Mycena alexandri]|uniref:Uncharacterized protein n=1 Tax=Mycena alexandri TaxID=1745969 RepID=A0AAD6T3C8_9AGAR|nr:hypothetical protein C8F04DRAFT_1255843 [Mycena alexandri]
MKFLSLILALAVVSASTVIPVPGEEPYSASNLSVLPDEPTDVTQALANNLLGVMQNYGLIKNFGVVGAHSHVELAPGEVMFQHGNATFSHQEIKVYDNVKDTVVPYNYRITSGDSPALLPLELGDITSDFAAAAGDHLAGIAYIRPLDRAALESGSIVKNHYNAAKTAGTAAPISLADATTTDAPSFFTRGVGNSTAPGQITILCSLCGDGNRWKDS